MPEQHFQPRWRVRALDVLGLAMLIGALGVVCLWDKPSAREVVGGSQDGLLEPGTGGGESSAGRSHNGPEETPAEPGEIVSLPLIEAFSPGAKPQAEPAEKRPDPPGEASAAGQTPQEIAGTKKAKPAEQASVEKPAEELKAATTTSLDAQEPSPKEVSAREKPKSVLETATKPLPAPGYNDAVVDQFIRYDIGQLRGQEGMVARNTFNSLGYEAIPAVIRGLNRAAKLRQSCPVIVLASKLRALLTQSRDPSMVELAIDHLGEDVSPRDPYYHSLMTLKRELVAMLPASHPRRRMLDMLATVGSDPAQLAAFLRSESAEERLAAVRTIRAAGLPLGDELLRLLSDADAAVCQEARATLRQLAQNTDYGPEPDASPEARAEAISQWRSWWAKQAANSVYSQVGKQSNEGLLKTLGSGDPNERWAAVVVVRTRRLPYYDELISLLRDPDLSVRREARRALTQLADGRDFGPDDNAAPAAVDQAVVQWQKWRKLMGLVAKYHGAPQATILETFKSPDALDRLAAATVARQKGLDLPEQLIALLRDTDEAIRQEARHALVQLAGGTDYGPSESTDAAAANEAANRWQKWLTWRNLVIAYGNDEPDALTARFADADSTKRWAAVAAARARKLPVPDKLISLLRDASDDIRQEARQALVELAGGWDFGPPPSADEAEVNRATAGWTKWMQREKLMPQFASMTSEGLAQAFKSSEPLQRWAAVAAARRQRAPLLGELIVMLRDPDNEVRQEARQALIQLTRGIDHGPPENATAAQCETAFHDWDSWWTKEKERVEKIARSELKRAEILKATNRTAARRHLEQIAQKYPGTESGRRAQELLTK